jgi:hypothetical protein
MLANVIRRLVPARIRPIRYLENKVRRETGDRIGAGPFRRMKYVARAFGSAYIPKLLGTYERELHPYLERACRLGLRRVIDIGAAEGYYAVGMALRCPDAEVVAFEMDEAARAALRALAGLNGVAGRVAVREKCDPDGLAAHLGGGRQLVICDCEGDEMTLLDPRRVPALASAFLLVELHDFIIPGCGAAIESRFRATHRVERVWQTQRAGSEFPYSDWYIRCLPSSYLDWTVSEWRPERMSWLWMEPNA